MARPKAAITREERVTFRTFSEVLRRLEAMAILRGRVLPRGKPNIGSLIEYYVLRGIEADENDLGISWEESMRLLDNPPDDFERLNPARKARVLALYKLAGILPAEEHPKHLKVAPEKAVSPTARAKMSGNAAAAAAV